MVSSYNPSYDREYSRKYMKKYRVEHPEKRREWEANRRSNLKLRVYEYLGGAKCVNCGCTDMHLLELNHKNGGGGKEYREKKTLRRILESILRDKRKNEFDVRCRVCNASHYLKLKYNVDFEIKFLG